MPDTKSQIPNEFRQLVESFYGCTAGNIYSPVWICGLEWGGDLPLDTTFSIYNLEPYGFEDIHCWSGEEFMGNFWATGSKFCEGVIKILTGLRDGGYVSAKCSWAKDKLIESNLIGPNGLALILNAFPICMQGTSVRWKNWDNYQIRLEDGSHKLLKEWTHLNNFGEYAEYVIEHRRKVFSAKVVEYKPQLIICFGNKDKHERLFGVVENQIPLRESFPSIAKGGIDCNLYKIKHPRLDSFTLVLVTPFPTGIYGLKSDDQFDIVSRNLTEIGHKYFGSNWLKSWSRESYDSPLTELERSYYDKLIRKRTAISELISAANYEITQLENVEKLICDDDMTAFSASLKTIKTHKENQISLMQEFAGRHKDISEKISKLREVFTKKYINFSNK